MLDSQKIDINTDEDCTLLVHTFYNRVQKDQRLNYLFNDFAKLDWDSHLPKMVDFWSNVILQTGRYRGNPYQAHLNLPLKESDFQLWIDIFIQTVDDLFAGIRAEHSKDIAQKVATMFTMRMKMDGILPFTH